MNSSDVALLTADHRSLAVEISILAVLVEQVV